MSGVVTVPELLDGHTVLDIECLDRIYLNGYVPALQVGGQGVTFELFEGMEQDDLGIWQTPGPARS